jgi:hypothetical protein
VNPFIWKTKAEVVERIAANGYADLIKETRSCARVHDMTKLHTHCGHCSQCVDRRFAVIAAGQAHHDPGEAYKVDLLIGERPAGPDREMALAYVRSASDIKQLEDVAFFARYGETSRIVGFFSEVADMVASRILDLHRRHASAICRVFDEAISSHAGDLRQRSLPADCLLSLIIGQRQGDSIYPEPSGAPEQTVPVGPEIRIAIDEMQRRVLFARWGNIRGVNADLIIALSAPFRQAMRDELAPEGYPFTNKDDLLSQTKCPTEETLRRRVFRC